MIKNEYLYDIYIDCGKCTRDFVVAACDAWDDTVREFERDMVSLIERNYLHYGFAERIQFALRIKGNPIERQITSLFKELENLLKTKLNTFEQLVVKLTLEHKDEWLRRGVHKERLLRIEEPQMYQTLVEHLAGNLHLCHSDNASEFDDPLCEMIAHYVFHSEYPLQADLIWKEVTKVTFDIIPCFPSPKSADYLEMVKIKAEEIIARVRKKVLETLLTQGNDYVFCACYRYSDRVETVQKLIEKNESNMPLGTEQ